MANKHKKKRKQKLRQQQRKAHQEKQNQSKTIRHNTAVNQEKHRIDWQPLEPNEDGMVADRRIMPRDERDRREGLLEKSQTTFNELLTDADWQAMVNETPFELGKVIHVSRGLIGAEVNGRKLICDTRGILTAEGTGYTNITAVGDRILVEQTADDRGLMHQVLPRRSGLARMDSFQTYLKQIIAANVDQILIVSAWRDPQIWFQMIDEYLIGASRNNLKVAICINKVDLAESMEVVEATLRPYANLGYEVIFASAEQGMGIDTVRQRLQGKTTVLAGLSGVGKSSLLNAVQPGLQLRTGVVSELKSREGRHTTTQAMMVPLAMGGEVIDTPGIKDMGVSGMHPDELILFYPDLEACMVNCRFSDCTHAHEPGCAVREGVENGRLAPWRLKNYVNLFERLDEEFFETNLRKKKVRR